VDTNLESVCVIGKDQIAKLDGGEGTPKGGGGDAASHPNNTKSICESNFILDPQEERGCHDEAFIHGSLDYKKWDRKWHWQHLSRVKEEQIIGSSLTDQRGRMENRRIECRSEVLQYKPRVIMRVAISRTTVKFNRNNKSSNEETKRRGRPIKIIFP
jgi:hypothetical protein